MSGDVALLTDEETARLDEDGAIVRDGVLSLAWLEQLRAGFLDAPAQSSGTQHVELTTSTPELASWSALRVHPLVLAAAEHVIRAPFAVTELHGRNPLPGYGQQGLHADAAPRTTDEPYSVVTAIWMLDDFNRDNGATRIVPGTYRLLSPVPKSFARPTAVHPSERIVCASAGSVLIMNGHLWHSGRTNGTHTPRRAAQMVMRRRA